MNLIFAIQNSGVVCDSVCIWESLVRLVEDLLGTRP